MDAIQWPHQTICQNKLAVFFSFVVPVDHVGREQRLCSHCEGCHCVRMQNVYSPVCFQGVGRIGETTAYAAKSPPFFFMVGSRNIANTSPMPRGTHGALSSPTNISQLY